MSALDRPRPAQNSARSLPVSLFVGALLVFLIPGASLGFFYYASMNMPDSGYPGLTWQYGLDRWSLVGAFVSLGLTVATILPLLTAYAFSRRTPAAFYWNLRIGWQTLRLFAAAQTLLQGA